MFARLFNWLFGNTVAEPVEVVDAEPVRAGSFFTSEGLGDAGGNRVALLQAAQNRALPVTPATFQAVGMDGASGSVFSSAKAAFNLGDSAVPDAQLLWYASQSFIGFQMCAVLAQQWLVHKACDVPARDAIRNGYKVTGADVTPELLAKIEAADKRYGIKAQCRELVRFSRVFGIRIALFKVDSPDPKYYERPFNPDGVTPGSYRGIVQIDPYWCVPELSMAGASNPASGEFYEPTYWTIQGRRYHRSHLVIVRGPEVPDVLKPSYQFAGVSIPQRIYERVYAAERTANEAPQLALTKRAMVFYTDTGKALANQQQFEERLQTWAAYRDNYGVKIADKEGDKVEQHDTALGDFDAVVMTQYQLVAAIANIPATKLLGTTPKGFNATGEYEEANYHEELESIQTNDMEPLVNRHHLLLIRSEIAPAAGVAPFNVSLVWNPTDTPTEKEEAEVQKLKAEADKAWVEAGALDGQDVRGRIIADPKSGYDGIAPAVPADAHPAAPGGAGHPFGAGDAVEFVTLDASDFDPVTGQYAEAELVTNQSYLNADIVAAKIAAQDFTVQVSPEFVTAAGKRFRIVIDGHHSLAAAVKCGACPVFLESNYAGSDYHNALTKLPAFGQEMEVSV